MSNITKSTYWWLIPALIPFLNLIVSSFLPRIPTQPSNHENVIYPALLYSESPIWLSLLCVSFIASLIALRWLDGQSIAHVIGVMLLMIIVMGFHFLTSAFNDYSIHHIQTTTSMSHVYHLASVNHTDTPGQYAYVFRCDVRGIVCQLRYRHLTLYARQRHYLHYDRVTNITTLRRQDDDAIVWFSPR